MKECRYDKQVEKWGIFEVRVFGKTEGNPYTDYDIQAVFTGAEETKTVNGFYDGNGEYVVRFMADFEGKYTFSISGSFSEQSYQGEFEAIKPTANNHGYVQVSDTCHFKYADGAPYYSVGTTCYAWVHQPVERQEQTLNTLGNQAFNKIRFCIFPKHYDYNYANPIAFPYEGTPCDNSGLNRNTMVAYMEDKSSNDWNFKKFNPEFFKWFDLRIRQLMEMGIEADLILFHPYDRWGFDGMGAENDDLYVKYMVARYAAYRNVWWSLANEYDYVKTKTVEDWERIAAVICENDKYGRLRSIHNGPHYYDFTKTWITHCSCQGTDRYKATEYTDELLMKYNKPVVWDEILYEGNLNLGWGNISGEELVRRFWEATMRGGHAGHGETYLQKADDTVDKSILWWSHGGVLHGESPERIAFLRKILFEIPGGYGLRVMPAFWDAVVGTIDREEDRDKTVKEYYLFYFSFMCPLYRDFYFDDDTEFKVDLIDTWNMTVVSQGTFKGHFRIIIGGKTYMAVRIQKK
jgi:hypothetical protein